jgi:hypothetical protein
MNSIFVLPFVAILKLKKYKQRYLKGFMNVYCTPKLNLEGPFFKLHWVVRANFSNGQKNTKLDRLLYVQGDLFLLFVKLSKLNGIVFENWRRIQMHHPPFENRTKKSLIFRCFWYSDVQFSGVRCNLDFESGSPGASFTKLTCVSDSSFGNFLL